MKFHAFTAIMAIATLAFSPTNYAQETAIKPDSFIGSYLTICMQNLNNLEALRSRLIQNQIPKFPSEQAKNFLMGMDGDAWPRPQDGALGNLVLALPAGKNICIVHARQANPNEVEQQFIKLVEKAPAPLFAELKNDTQGEHPNAGKTRVISYTWSVPNVKRKMLFMLSTATSETTRFQATGTASMISE